MANFDSSSMPCGLCSGKNLGVFNDQASFSITPVIFSLVTYFMFRTGQGLRLRAVGENPQAAEAAGVPVIMYRLLAILAGSALIGLAGAFISVLSTKMWIANMVGGRGWIAVALVIFARWSPWKALAGAVLFGCIEALIPQLVDEAGIAAERSIRPH